MAKSASEGRLIYGGSFNPLHIGHMRLAIECMEVLRERIGQVEFLPSAHPPHKPARGMLPFTLRAHLIERAITGFPYFRCNRIEGDREEPSYTYETLKKLGSPRNLYFLLGSSDFYLLPEWWRGLELPAVSNLVIVPREEYDLEGMLTHARAFWPNLPVFPGYVEGHNCNIPDIWSIDTPWNTRIYFLHVPYLDISASRIRQLWLAHKNIDYLVPPEVNEVLDRERQTVRDCWRENIDICSR